MTYVFAALVAQSQFVAAYGGTDNDWGYSLVQTSDGGYAISGWVYVANNDDLFLMKFDSTGALQWNHTVGGTRNDYGYSLVQTSDDGYAVAGMTNSFGAADADMFLVKFDGGGMLQWARTVGGTGIDGSYAFLVQTSDGGYAVAGRTYSFGAGNADMFLAKLDSAGAGCVGTFQNPVVTSPPLTVTSPSPTVISPSPTVTVPAPVVTSPSPDTTIVCAQSINVSERRGAAVPGALSLQLLPGALLLVAASPVDVSVYDVTGRLVRALAVERSVRVPLSRGVYFVVPAGGSALAATVR